MADTTLNPTATANGTPVPAPAPAGGVAVPDNGATIPPAEAKKPDTAAPEPVPYDRFREVNERAKTLEVEVERFKSAEAKRADDEKKGKEKQLAAEAKWQELATARESERDTAVTERDTLKSQVAAYEAALQRVYEGRVTAVPEMYRPLLSQLPLPERMTWIAENEDKLTANGKPAPGGIPSTPNPKGAGALTDDERRKRAARTF